MTTTLTLFFFCFETYSEGRKGLLSNTCVPHITETVVLSRYLPSCGLSSSFPLNDIITFSRTKKGGTGKPGSIWMYLVLGLLEKNQDNLIEI